MTGRKPKNSLVETSPYDTLTELYQALFERATEGIFIADGQGQLIEANPYGCEILGYTHEEILNLSWQDIIPAEGQGQPLHPEELQADKTTLNEQWLHCKDSRLLPVELTRRQLSNDHWLVIARDISERKQAERKLQQANDLLRAIIEAVPTAIVGLDLDGNVQTVWNPAAEKMLGWKAEEVMGRPLPSVPVEDQEEFRRFRERIRSGLIVDGMPVQRRRRDGSPIDYNIYASPLYDPQGQINGNISVLVDITERKQLEKQLLESEERFRLLSESSLTGIYLLQEDRFRYVNPAMAGMFGYTVEELMDRQDPLDLVHPDDRPIVAENIHRRITDEAEGVRYDFRGQRKDGSVVYIEVHSRRIEFSGIMGVLGSLVDITERKKAEMQLQASEQLFRALVENSPDFIARYDRELRRIYINPALQKLFEKPAEELLNQTPADESLLYAPQSYIDQLRQVIETGAEHTVEIPLGTSQSGIDWDYVRFEPEFGPDGQVASVLAVGRNINEIKAKERRFQTLAENFPDFVIRFNRDGRLIYVNPAVEKAFGLPTAAFLGKTLLELPQHHRSEQNEVLLLLLHRVFDEGVTNNAEICWDTQMGRRIFEIRYVPEKDTAGNVASILGIAHDITERKQAEAERQAHLRFLASMDQANRAIQGTNDLEQMMSDVLGTVLSIFDCDRAFLLYPCDPEAPSWQVPMERTRPEFSGAFVLGLDVSMDPDAAKVCQTLLAATGPVKFGAGSEYPLPTEVAKRFSIESMLAMAIYPKVDKPYMFGLHQCSYPRAWTPQEERLLQEIGRRLTDGLTSLLVYRNLQESELRYREVFENVSDSLFVFDVTTAGNFRFTGINAAAARLSGVSSADVHGKFLEEVVRPEVVAKTLPHFRRCLEVGEPLHYEEEYLSRPLGRRYLDTTLIPVRNNAGVISRLIAFNRDITERKQVESYLDKLTAISPGVMGTFYLKPDGTVCMPYASPGIWDLYGLRSEDVIHDATKLLARTHPDDVNRVNESIAESVRTMSLWNVEFRVLHPTRGELWLEGHTMPEPHPDGGIIWYGFVLDITQRKRAEESLHEQEKQSQSLLHLSKNLERAQTYNEVLNAARNEVKNIIGYQNLWVYLLTDDKQHFKALMAGGQASETMIIEEGIATLTIQGDRMLEEIAEAKEIVVVEDARTDERTNKEIVTRFGNRTIVNVPIFLFDKRLGTVGMGTYGEEGVRSPTPSEQKYLVAMASHMAVALDRIHLLTERQRAEVALRQLNQELEQRVLERTAQLEAANKELEAFAYSVSHDLRAPLRHIDGFLELLEKRIAPSLDERSQHYMTTISTSAKRMGTLIDDLLSFSRMGRNEMSRNPVNLTALVQEVIRQLESEAQERSIRWQIADLPIVNGDRAMLQVVLVNLIANAVKFTRGRTPAEIKIGCQPGQGTETIFFVRDNGAGFDMDYADKLFGVFQRLHRADEFEGTGIGLANVRRIIQRHGGRTWAEGKVDQGATFFFSLPQSIQGV